MSTKFNFTLTSQRKIGNTFKDVEVIRKSVEDYDHYCRCVAPDELSFFKRLGSKQRTRSEYKIDKATGKGYMVYILDSYAPNDSSYRNRFKWVEIL